MEQKKSEFDKVLGAWDILVIAFGAMIGWGWVVSSGSWIQKGGVVGASIAFAIGGGIPTGITQNVKDLLSSREVTNIFENSDFIYMLNQAAGDRQILADQLNISPHQLSYVTHSGEGEGLLFYGNVILPFVDRFPTDLELYRIMTTKLTEVQEAKEA